MIIFIKKTKKQIRLFTEKMRLYDFSLKILIIIRLVREIENFMKSR